MEVHLGDIQKAVVQFYLPVPIFKGWLQQTKNLLSISN